MTAVSTGVEDVWSVGQPSQGSSLQAAAGAASSEHNNAEEGYQGIILGVDLGTSNSVAAVWHPGRNRAEVVYRTPSTLTFRDSWDTPDVGLAAAAPDSGSSSSNCCASSSHVTCAKMALGLSSAQIRDGLPPAGTSDTDSGSSRLPPNLDLSTDKPSFRCHVNKGAAGGGDSGGSDSSRRVSPEEACTHILRAVRLNAEDYLFRTNPLFRAANANTSAGSPCYDRDKNATRATPTQAGASSGSGSGYSVYRVVIGVPATFSEAQRREVRRAAAAAGFADVHLLVESTAAAVAYGLGVAGNKTVMTVDVGGGTTDVTVMRVTQRRRGAASETRSEFEVLCTAGARTGGRDVDALLLHFAVQQSQCSQTGAANTERYKYEELRAAREAKELLSLHEEAAIALPVPGGSEAVTIAVTASQLAEAALPVLESVCSVVRDCLQSYRALGSHSSCKSGPATIEEVVLVGGSTRMPCLRKALIDTLGSTKAITIRDDAPTTTFEMCTSISADEAVAEGLAIRGAILMGVDRGQLQDLLMMDALPNSLGVLVPLVDCGAGGLAGGDSAVHFNQVRGNSLYSKSSTGIGSGAGEGEAAEFAFMQVLPAGQRIPGSATRHFAIDAAAALHKKVSLCVVERNCCFPSPSAVAPTAAATADIYDVVGTYDFPVPTTITAAAAAAASASGTAPVDTDAGILAKFTVTESGELGFAVVQQQLGTEVDVPATESAGASAGAGVADANAETGSGALSKMEMMLLGYTLALVFAFLWLKSSGLGVPAAHTPDGSFPDSDTLTGGANTR